MRRGLSVLLLLCLAASTAWSATYRWTDDQGQTIYSQTPPPDGRPFTTIGAPPPPPDAAGSRKAVDELRQSQADRREDKQLAKEEAQKSADKQAQIDKNCGTARSNVASLEGTTQARIRLPDGTVRRLTAEERQSRLDEARSYLDKHCQ